MNLELLPNEIILDIFNYFNGIDLLHAFYGLNIRINSILYKQFRFYSFQFSYRSKRVFDMICQKHLPFITNRVIILSLSDADNTPEQINLFFYIPSLNQFIHLRTLSISSLRSYQILMKIINECQYLLNLTRLEFYCYSLQNCQIDWKLIIDNVWCVPKLSYCHLSIFNQQRQSYYIPSKISFTLEYVHMFGHPLKWNQINRLFEYTPRLKHLSINIDSSNDDDYIPFPTLSLMHLDIITCPSDASRLSSFLQNMPNLRYLGITLLPTLIKGDQWEQIIRNFLPKLKEFRLQMKSHLSQDVNIQERVDQLIDSYQNSFWIDEHQWFVRCFALKTNIYFHTLSYSNYCDEGKFADYWKSTYPHDNQENFYNNMRSIYNETFFDQPIPLDIRLSNLGYLHIKLPIHDQFWSMASDLNSLYSLIVSFEVDTFQSQLQTLLDRAPNLRYLKIRQDKPLSVQISLFNYTNVSVSVLDLQNYNYYFTEEECIKLCHSPLGVKCEVLHINVKNFESIITLVRNMVNLQGLHVKYEAISKENNNNNEFYDENKNKIIDWLKNRLPSTCFVGIHPDTNNLIRIWIS